MIHKFSDFAQTDILDGEKKRLSDIVNEEIVVTGYNITPSKKNDGKCLKLQYKLTDELHVTFTGSSVLINQIEKYKDEIPFVAIIKHIGNYYSFT